MDRKAQKLFESLEEKILKCGEVLDDFMDSATERRKYLCEVLLRVPLLIILHQWMLISPYSDYRILELALFVVRYGVAAILFWTYACNTGALMVLYTLTFTNVASAWLQQVNYWTLQEELHEICVQRNIFIWSDGITIWIIPFLFSIVLQAANLLIRIRWYTFEVPSTLAYKVIIITFSIDILAYSMVVFGEISYWIKSAMLIFIIYCDVTISTELDIIVDKRKLQNVQNKYNHSQFHNDKEPKLAYLSQIRNLVDKINMKSKGGVNANRLPDMWFLRDVFVSFGIPYLLFTFFYELLMNQQPWMSFIAFRTISEISASWITTSVIVVAVSYIFGVISNICVFLSYVFISVEFTWQEVFHLNVWWIVHTTALTDFVETDIILLENNKKIDAMGTVYIFTFYAIVFKMFIVLEKKIFEAVNSGATSGLFFRFKAGLLTGILSAGPSLITYNVANDLSVDPWVLFMASGNSFLILGTFFMLVESFLLSLSWRATRHVANLDDAIHYCRLIKKISYVICAVLQIYFRFTCGLFKTWWLLRFVLSMFTLLGIVLIVYKIEKQRLEARSSLTSLMNSLVDVTYDPMETEKQRKDNIEGNEKSEPHNCSICFTTISSGKVLSCTHAFHEDCIRRWFQIKFCCPLCNAVQTVSTENATTSKSPVKDISPLLSQMLGQGQKLPRKH